MRMATTQNSGDYTGESPESHRKHANDVTASFLPSLTSRTCSYSSSECGGSAVTRSDSGVGPLSGPSPTSHSSGPSSAASYHNKLPYLEQKSISVSSLNQTNATERFNLCRSPSCPQIYSEFEDEIPMISQGNLNASIHPAMARMKGQKDNLRLPDIFSSSSNPASSRASPRDQSTENDLRTLSLSQQRSARYTGSRSSSQERSNQLSHSQPAALLLPLNITDRPSGKKHNKRAGKQARRQSDSSSSGLSAATCRRSNSLVVSRPRLVHSEQDESGCEDKYVSSEDENDDQLTIRERTPRATHNGGMVHQMALASQEEDEDGDDETEEEDTPRTYVQPRNKCREWLDGVEQASDN